MGNLDVLEYRVDRIEKVQDEQVRLLKEAITTMEDHNQKQELKNQERDIKLRNIILVGSFVIVSVYQLGMDFVKKLLGF